MFLLFLATMVILVMYILIFIVAHKRQNMLRNRGLGESVHDQHPRSAFSQDLKAIRVLLVVVGVLIFCWYLLLVVNFCGCTVLKCFIGLIGEYL